ncbi:MAG: type 4a pilus biogenesis protein PilO [Candidatus Moranbacteria bacterium]|nr:type 4a pilus biogenesis protein PilO [Candidatus Moranbacteria bacterium]
MPALRFLFFPFSVLASLILVIAFIWPSAKETISLYSDYDKLRDQYNVLSVREQNMNSLFGSLEEASSSVDRLVRYVPFVAQDARVVQGLQEVASQSGLSLSSVVPQPLNETGLINSSPKDMPVVQRDQSLRLSVEYFGSYESVQSFLEKLYSLDRIHLVSAVSIERSTQSGDDVNLLFGEAVVDFLLIPAFSGPMNDHFYGYLDESTFDTSFVSSIDSRRVKALIPPITDTSTDRSNPFVP